MSEERLIEPFIERDDISWWAGARYVDRRGDLLSYIRKTPCFTRWGAVRKARRMASAARRLRDRDLAGFTQSVGDPR